MFLPSFSLEGKTAIVTGAGKGIGRAIAIGFAEAGADVGLIARTQQDLDEVKNVIEKDFGRKAYAIKADVTVREDIVSAFKSIQEKAGKLDILVNNAGMNIRTPAAEVTDAEWDQIVNTNLKSAFMASQEAAKMMIESGGRIINIASVAGHTALPTGVVYGATKAALIQMTKILAYEWGKHNIHVNALGPWYFETPLTEKLLQDEKYVQKLLSVTPLNRIGQLPELVGPAVFLASEAGNYVTGQTLFIDGGMTIHGF
ncbi:MULTISPECIES: glucose 1-dehydrogenase [Bacillaceae]|uniref:Glucose 1-dehydrogenase n=1 Tax=Metabacillus sediminis TaxID=3117746 RepID=A0ABZ2NN03_9BACI|nr:glucose 1-dehydrogenase [Bacillus sp. SJS]KZZ83072.1 2-deoxy-D-gluconate 3-dehydrogenase [Bacillus sp. SJS]